MDVLTFQKVKMNGPETVRILRNSLKFRHIIIGRNGFLNSCVLVTFLMALLVGILQVSLATPYRPISPCSSRAG